MASVGNVLVGVAVAEVGVRAQSPALGRSSLACIGAPEPSGIALTLDHDVVASAFGTPDAIPLGHCDVSDSLAAAAVAAVMATVVLARAPLTPMPATSVAAFAAAGIHCDRDIDTDDGRGVPALRLASDARFFLPARPLSVASVCGALLSIRGGWCIAVELLWIGPQSATADLAWARLPARAAPRSGSAAPRAGADPRVAQ